MLTSDEIAERWYASIIADTIALDALPDVKSEAMEILRERLDRFLVSIGKP